MRAGQSILLIALFALAGCDRITGADKQQIRDAEAVGYACRVSLKTPEDCMKENETKSPSYVLEGWKAADKDIQGQLIDPSMGKHPVASAVAQSAPAVTESGGKAAGARNEKPAAAAAPGAPAVPKPTVH